ncbi:hypothetical protein KKF61_07260, partial [Patescibacteria group bacterium]|nr:hypothetical protein [Patescibacteria group bacterium]
NLTKPQPILTKPQPILTKPQPILTKPQPDKLLTGVRFGEYGTKKKAGRGVVIPGPACNH